MDAVYMEAVQAITGSGGWPMSMFLTPDRRPFFGGTYFPPTDRGGSPSFRTVLDALTDVWEQRRDEVETQADELSEAIRSRSVIPARAGGTTPLDPQGTGTNRRRLEDAAAGRIGRPFRPRMGWLRWCPQIPPADPDRRGPPPCSVRTPGPRRRSRSRIMATRTLDAMAAGGIHDHLVGGFARYSTDGQWLVPHFEKMLYDQAGLLRAYLHGWQETGEENYLRTMAGIVDYVGRYLTTPEGGVCSAEDADSEGVEGRFYVWTPEQIRAAVDSGVDQRDGSAAATIVDGLTEFFGVTESGNFEGSTILHRPVGGRLGGDDAVESGRVILAEARDQRVRPGRDDKVLTEWNAMYASALAEAAAGTSNPEWRDAAVGHRRVSGRPSPGRGRSVAAQLEGRGWRPPSGLCRRLRLAGRLLYPAGRAHRPVRSGPSGPCPQRKVCWTCSTTRTVAVSSPPAMTPRPSSSGPRTSSTGPHRRPMPSPHWPWPDSGPSPAPTGSPTRPARWSRCSATSSYGTRPPSPTPSSPPPCWPTGSPRWSSPVTAPISWTSCAVGGDPTPSWPGASRHRRPCGRARTDHRAYVCRNYACQLPADDPDDTGGPTAVRTGGRGDPVSKASTRHPTERHRPRRGAQHPPPQPDRGGRGNLADGAGLGLPCGGHHRRRPGLGDVGPGPGGLARRPWPRPGPLRCGRGPTGRGARA